jgi:hypothetical protein
MSPNAGDERVVAWFQPVSAAAHMEPKYPFGDLILYLTYGVHEGVNNDKKKEICNWKLPFLYSRR